MNARLLALALGAATLIAMSCHSLPGRPRGQIDVVARDTLRGVLAVVGAEPLSALVLTSSSGSAAFALEGTQESLMRRLSRMEVMTAGRMTSRRSPASPALMVFEADSFVVRAADRVAAYDGVVARDGESFFLVSGAARVRVRFLPAALKRSVGARIFLVGPLDREPIAYGTIESAP